MAQISFYKQFRNDGGVRSGITIDHDKDAWMHFEPGSGSDRALLWYVDVELSGKAQCRDPEAARDLFVKHAEVIKKSLDEVIDALEADNGMMVWPITSSEAKIEPDMRLRITCSAIRRLPARELAKGIRQLRQNWSQHIQQLESMATSKQPA